MAEKGYIRSLDGVRAIAIILVMSFHTFITAFGWIGVQLFFVLSGFLITGILWHEKDKPAPLSYKFKKFWIRRSLRIFPLYYCYLLVLAIIYLFFHFPSYFPLFFPYAVSYTANFPLTLMHTHGNPLFNHLWSLSVEEQFYVLFPLILLLAPKRLIRFLLPAIVILSPLLRYILGAWYESTGYSQKMAADAVNFNTFCQLDAFCTGGLIHIFSLDTRIKRPWLLFGTVAVLTVTAGLFTFAVSPSIPGEHWWLDWGFYHYYTNTGQHVWHYTCLNILSASLILAMVRETRLEQPSLVRRLLENKWMVNIGRVSYGMYIYHWLLWAYVFVVLFRPVSYPFKVLLFIPYVLFVYGFAELSYRLFEVRFIRLKDKFFPAAKRSPLPATEKEDGPHLENSLGV